MTQARRTSRGADTAYALVLSYRAKDWMFVRPGESLVFLADGERIGLSLAPDAPQRRDVEGGWVTEAVVYPATLAILEKLASAKHLAAKLIGEKYTFELEPKRPEVACSFGSVVRDAR